MKIIRKKKKKSSHKKDPKKESYFRGLSVVLQQHGIEVRRERLKQGFGWRVASGSCVARDQKIVFVDSRMSQDDQVSFLFSEILERGLHLTSEQLELLPEHYREQLAA